MWHRIEEHPCWVKKQEEIENEKFDKYSISKRLFIQKQPWPLLVLGVYKSAYPGDDGYKVTCCIKFNEEDVFEPYGIPSSLFKEVYEMLKAVKQKPVSVCTGLLGGMVECGQAMPCVLHG